MSNTEQNSILDQIVALSRYYGRDAEWVIAGGGNTSVKNEDTLWVKASGTSLGEATSGSFVALDRKKLAAMWEKEYPSDVDARESEALSDLMQARQTGETLRPSVETGMHEAIPHRYVVHTHPTLVNALTCSRDGKDVANDLFGKLTEWVPAINPGYVLSNRIAEITRSRGVKPGAPAPYIFLENHGVTVAGESPAEIQQTHRKIISSILDRISIRPDMRNVQVDLSLAARIQDQIAEAMREDLNTQPTIVFFANREILRRAESVEAIQPLMRPFSPDHIVYAGDRPLYAADLAGFGDAYRERRAENGAPPRIVVVRGVGAFAVGTSEKVADTAMRLFLDAVKIASYADNFGGPQGMADDQIDFILGWEVERFRAKVSTE